MATNNSNYSVTVVRSSRELTKKERVRYSSLNGSKNLDKTVTPDENLVINPAMFVVLAIHNEKAKEGNSKDYETLVLEDDMGVRYYTGSKSFRDAFMNIWETMTDDGDEEEWALEVIKRESSNYAGRYFLTCNII